MKKVTYLLTLFLLSFFFLSIEASAKEEKKCTITHKIESTEVEKIENIGPVQNEKGEVIQKAVKVSIRVKGFYTIQHKNDAVPGPTKTIDTVIPYIAANETRDTIPAWKVEAYENLAKQDMENRLNNGLKKICEKLKCDQK